MSGDTKNGWGIMKKNYTEETEEDVEDTRTQSKKDGSKQKALQDAEKIAVELLAKRAITATEMRKKLLQKRFSPKIVEALVSDYQSRGFINDRLYAELFFQSRWSSLTWGPKRIKQVTVLGYNHKLRILLEIVIDKIAKFKVKQDRFSVIKGLKYFLVLRLKIYLSLLQ